MTWQEAAWQDRAAANAASAAANELVHVLLDDGVDAMLARADAIRQRSTKILEEVRAVLRTQPKEKRG